MLPRFLAALLVCSLPLLCACNGQVSDGPQPAADAGQGGSTGGRSAQGPAAPAGPGGTAGSAGAAGSTPSVVVDPTVPGTTTPAPFAPLEPTAAVANICAQAAPTAKEASPSLERLVGRFQACDGSLGDTGHAGVEISGALRWRFLDLDATTGALVPAPDSAQTRGYVQNESLDGDLVFSLDTPGSQVALRLSGISADAMALSIGGPAAGAAEREYVARATPSANNGLDNHGDLQGDFDCSLVGTWELPMNADEQPGYAGVRTIAFDDAGRFYAFRKENAVLGLDAVDETGTWFIQQKTLNLVSIAGDIGTCAQLPRVLRLAISFGAGGKGGVCGASKQDVIATDACSAEGVLKGFVYIARR